MLLLILCLLLLPLFVFGPFFNAVLSVNDHMYVVFNSGYMSIAVS